MLIPLLFKNRFPILITSFRVLFFSLFFARIEKQQYKELLQ